MAFQKQTHCKNGHEFTSENVRWSLKGDGTKRRVCRTCNNEYHRRLTADARARGDDTLRAQWRKSKLWTKYQVTLEQWQAQFDKQGGRCAGCMKVFGTERSNIPCVDHDHETGEFRGLLCHECNRALGLLKDSITTLQTLVLYLQR
jgi:hypothetical protein